MLKAVTRQASAVDAKIRAINDNSSNAPPISTANFFDHHATAEDVAVMVTEQDFLDAHRELVPSVSAGELAHYESVRAAFEGGRDKQPQQQQQQNNNSSVEMSFDIEGVAGNNKGKGKAVASSTTASTTGSSSVSSKGKGKAVATTAPATASDEEEEAGGNEGDQYGSYQNLNGRSSTTTMMMAKDKGKGKATGAAGAKFQDGTASDDENLY